MLELVPAIVVKEIFPYILHLPWDGSFLPCLCKSVMPAPVSILNSAGLLFIGNVTCRSSSVPMWSAVVFSESVTTLKIDVYLFSFLSTTTTLFSSLLLHRVSKCHILLHLCQSKGNFSHVSGYILCMSYCKPHHSGLYVLDVPFSASLYLPNTVVPWLKSLIRSVTATGDRQVHIKVLHLYYSATTSISWSCFLMIYFFSSMQMMHYFFSALSFALTFFGHMVGKRKFCKITASTNTSTTLRFHCELTT